MDDEDRNIIAHYNKMPWQKPTYPYESSSDNYGDGGVAAVMTGVMFVTIMMGVLLLVSTNVDGSKQEIAQGIYDIEMGEFTCNELESKLNRQSFSTHHLLKQTIEKQIVSDGCMSRYELQEKKDIHYCLTHDTVTCRVDALKNPEKYETREPFNTRGRL